MEDLPWNCALSLPPIVDSPLQRFLPLTRRRIETTQAQPYGFDVGQSEKGNVFKGLDLGVEGMRVGGQVKFSRTMYLELV